MPVAVRSKAAAVRLLSLQVRITSGAWMCIFYCVLSRKADHSSKGVLPTVLRRCVWYRNLKNEKALVRDGPQRHGKKRYQD
jgi:hypothetical protein